MNDPVNILKKFHPHPFSYLAFYIGGIVFVVVSYFLSWLLFAFAILTFVIIEISRRAETFYILDTGVAREYNLLSTFRKYAEYEKIQNLEVNQSFLDNMLGIGNLFIDTAGGDTTEVNFRGIGDPYGIEKIIRAKMK